MTDRDEILQLIYRYAELIDAGDFEGLWETPRPRRFQGPRTLDRVRRGEHRQPVRHDHPPLPRGGRLWRYPARAGT